MLSFTLLSLYSSAHGQYLYKQPHRSICDVSSTFEGGFLCAIRPSRIETKARDTFFDKDLHHTLKDKYYGFGYHAIVFPTPGTVVKGVYIHFKGSYGRPYSQDTEKFQDPGFLMESASSGYIMIQIAYNNRYAINDEECASNRNLDNCAGRVRADKLNGRALVPKDLIDTTIEDTPVADSIEHRLIVLTKYLEDQGFKFPIKFIRNDKVLWNRLRVGGHSQGSGMAAYLAKNFGVAHACLLAGIHDTYDDINNPEDNVTADWFLTAGNATPVSNQRAVLCQEDPAITGFEYGLSLLGLKKGLNYRVKSFPGGYFDENGKSIDGHEAVDLDPRFKSLRDAACFGSSTDTLKEFDVTYTPERNLGNPTNRDCHHLLLDGVDYLLGCIGGGTESAAKAIQVQAAPTACNVLQFENFSNGVMTRNTAWGGSEMAYYRFKKVGTTLDITMNDNNDTQNKKDKTSFNDIHFRLSFPSANFTVENTNIPCE